MGVIGYFYCEECDYETRSGEEMERVYQVCMDGGYISSDGRGGAETKCPKCGKDSLVFGD